MSSLRALLIHRRGWFALLMAFALAVRLIVPTGFMFAAGSGRMALTLCPGTMAVPMAAMPNMHHEKSGGEQHGKAEVPCAFAGIGVATLGSADVALLVAAVVFALLLASRAVPRLLPGLPGRLRPPLRAPPAAA